MYQKLIYSIQFQYFLISLDFPDDILNIGRFFGRFDLRTVWPPRLPNFEWDMIRLFRIITR